MGMKLDEAITRYKNNAEFERTHGNLQGCLEFKQLAKWLEKLQKIEKIISAEADPIICNNFGDVRKVQAIREVLEDGNE